LASHQASTLEINGSINYSLVESGDKSFILSPIE